MEEKIQNGFLSVIGLFPTNSHQEKFDTVYRTSAREIKAFVLTVQAIRRIKRRTGKDLWRDIAYYTGNVTP